jgi:hypothetical protein
MFSTLSAYGSTEEENYLTESFAFLLRTLIDRIPEDGIRILNHISAKLPYHLITNPQTIFINTQVSIDQGQGRIDLEIREADDTLVYIEIKHDSPLSPGQLEFYLKNLQASKQTNNKLVLLTRSRSSQLETTLKASDYHQVCWYEIYNWLTRIRTTDGVSKYLIDNFLEFLEYKNMNLKKVTWEYEQGLQSMLNLSNMLEAAAKEVSPLSTIKRTAGWSWRGIYFNQAFFFGFRYEHPMKIVYENNTGSNPTEKAELDLEMVHFLALNKDEQFELIVDFFRRAIAEVTVGKGTKDIPECGPSTD